MRYDTDTMNATDMEKCKSRSRKREEIGLAAKKGYLPGDETISLKP